MAARTVLVPLDGSALGEHALPYAIHLAHATHARLVLVHAAKDSVTRRRGEEALSHLAETLSQQGLAVEAHVRYREPGALILQAAAIWEADLIAMSTHGRSGLGRWLYGSVADHVLRHASAPVLLVPARCDHPWPPDRSAASGDVPRGEPRPETRSVLVMLDGSARAEAAIPPARDLATALGARLDLVRTAPPPPVRHMYGEAPLWPGLPDLDGDLPRDLPGRSDGPFPDGQPSGAHFESWLAQDIGVSEEALLSEEYAASEGLEQARTYLCRLAQALRERGVHVETHALTGDPAAAVTALSHQLSVDAIVLSTHGRSGVLRLAMGSVATDVLRRTTVPLLLVGPAAAPRQSAATELEPAEHKTPEVGETTEPAPRAGLARGAARAYATRR